MYPRSSSSKIRNLDSGIRNPESGIRKLIFPYLCHFRNFWNLDFSTFDHCILYSFLRGFSLWQRGIDSTKQMTVLLFLIKKNQKRAAECGLGEARFWFFSRIFTRCIKKSKNAKLKTNSSFRRFLKKSLWNHLKNLRPLPIDPAWKISIKDGFLAPYLFDEWPFH